MNAFEAAERKHQDDRSLSDPLVALRATYLLVAAGGGVTIWPAIIHPANAQDLMQGVANSLLAAVSLLAVLGIRYPLKMLPLLLFELIWKSIWLFAFAWPLWSAHQIDAATAQSIKACLMGIIFPIVIPWPYVLENYVKRHSDRWRRASAVIN